MLPSKTDTLPQLLKGLKFEQKLAADAEAAHTENMRTLNEGIAAYRREIEKRVKAGETTDDPQLDEEILELLGIPPEEPFSLKPMGPNDGPLPGDNYSLVHPTNEEFVERLI